jgi:ATPase subunit of ABC transporter with duplicated ATPase domains
VAAERALADGSDDGMKYAEALADWGDHGGYELEAKWAAAAQRSVKTPVDDFATRLVGELSGGERKRLVLDLLLTSGADVLLLDEPDNYLDIPTRAWLEEQIRQCRSTILMVSHDRTLLERVSTKIVVIEGSGCWVHGGSYASFPEARQKRQEQLGDELKRWNDEERRLFQHMKIMKQRAAQNFKNATKANAAETRWEKFVAAGPPPPPVPDQQIHVRLRGADAARRVVKLEQVCRSATCSCRSPTRCTTASGWASSARTAPARRTCCRRSRAPARPTTARSRSGRAPRSACSPRSTTGPSGAAASAWRSCATACSTTRSR